MKNELTLKEAERIKTLEDKGYNIDELTRAIVHEREAAAFNDINGQIRRLLR